MTSLLLLLAVAPAVVLIIYISKKDRIEKEPRKLILKLLLWGAVAAIPAAGYEALMTDGILAEILPETSLMFKIIDNIFITAFAEELVKYIVAKRCTWGSKEFNCVFDGVVYAVAASMGFALLENIFYVLDSGLGVALMRAVLSVPGHAIDGVFMGCHYGLAKNAMVLGNRPLMRKELRKAFWIPVLIHGIYDLALSMESGWFILGFFVFYIFVAVKAVKKVNSMSLADTYIGTQTET